MNEKELLINPESSSKLSVHELADLHKRLGTAFICHDGKITKIIKENRGGILS